MHRPGGLNESTGCDAHHEPAVNTRCYFVPSAETEEKAELVNEMETAGESATWRFELFIAHRHLTRRRKTGFISDLLYFGSGVTSRRCGLIIVLSVMSGFDRELKRKIVSVQPHLRIEKVNGVDDAERDIAAIKNQNIPNLVSVSGYIEGQAILRSDKNAQGVIVRGVDVVNEDLSFFEKNLVSGTISFQESVSSETKRTWWFKKTVARTPSIVIGDGLARRCSADR